MGSQDRGPPAGDPLFCSCLRRLLHESCANGESGKVGVKLARGSTAGQLSVANVVQRFDDRGIGATGVPVLVLESCLGKGPCVKALDQARPAQTQLNISDEQVLVGGNQRGIAFDCLSRVS